MENFWKHRTLPERGNNHKENIILFINPPKGIYTFSDKNRQQAKW